MPRARAGKGKARPRSSASARAEGSKRPQDHGRRLRILLTASWLVASNLVPVIGIVLFDWSLLEVVLVVWIEGVVMLIAASAKFLVLHPRIAILAIPIGWSILGVFLVLQLAFLVLWFALAEAQQDFFTFALGLPDMAKRIAWGTLALVVLQGLAFWWRFLRGPERALPAWRLLVGPLAHIAVVQGLLVAGGYLVRAGADATPALVLLVALKSAVDLGLYSIEETWNARRARPHYR